MNTAALLSVVLFATFLSASAKVYDRCELAKQLLNTYKFPRNQIATWVCIAQHESNYNTRVTGPRNSDGSRDHGIFQINDRYWCFPGKGCNTSCDKFQDDNISDDVTCIKKIFQETAARTGDGFTAWSTYNSCRGGAANSYINGCGI